MLTGMKRRNPTSPSSFVAGSTSPSSDAPPPDTYPVQHVSRTGKIYYLVEHTSKLGRPAYTFSTSPEGKPGAAVPDGYEIYENANAQVFLRKKNPQIIDPSELALVKDTLRAHGPEWKYWVEAKKDTIVVYDAGHSADGLSRLTLMFRARLPTDDEQRRSATYVAMLRFTLVDRKTREFVTERFCFRGSVDDWIHIGGPGRLAPQCRKFIQHLGRESFYELF
jgi:hypothetical protein